MKVMDIKVYPKVFCEGKTQKIYLENNLGQEKELYIKIQPMEIYEVKHTRKYRIDEEERYAYKKMQIGTDLCLVL